MAKASTKAALDELSMPKELTLNAQQNKALNRKIEDTIGKTLSDRNALDEQTEEYKREGGRRWRSKVTSTRKGVQHFEMMIADPRNPIRPVKILGRCGVIIEKGLPLYVINSLKQCHRIETDLDPMLGMPNNSMGGILHTEVKLPNFNVEVYNEVENPEPIGTVK